MTHLSGEPEIISVLGAEFERIAKESTSSPRSRGPVARSRRRTAVIAVAGFMAVAAVAGASSGVFSVGDVISGDESPAPGHPPSGVDELVVATGETKVAGTWRITSYRSSPIVHDGVVVQPEGLPCVRLTLLRRPGGSPLAGSGQCGEPPKGGFEIKSLPVKDDFGRAEVILWGRVPETSGQVRLTADGTSPITAKTLEGPDDFDGDVWVIAASPELANPRVDWLDQRGEPQGPPHEVASEFARANPLIR